MTKDVRRPDGWTVKIQLGLASIITHTRWEQALDPADSPMHFEYDFHLMICFFIYYIYIYIYIYIYVVWVLSRLRILNYTRFLWNVLFDLGIVGSCDSVLTRVCKTWRPFFSGSWTFVFIQICLKREELSSSLFSRVQHSPLHYLPIDIHIEMSNLMRVIWGRWCHSLLSPHFDSFYLSFLIFFCIPLCLFTVTKKPLTCPSLKFLYRPFLFSFFLPRFLHMSLLTLLAYQLREETISSEFDWNHIALLGQKSTLSSYH